MQRLEVLIEENAFGSVRPVEVVADAPVSALVPALVEELNLPQTDLFGKKLVYMLRQSDGGRIIPENTTLAASGVQAGARLALDSFVLDGSVATLTQAPTPQTPNDPLLHSSATIADAGAFNGFPSFPNAPSFPDAAPGNTPPFNNTASFNRGRSGRVPSAVNFPPPRKQRRWGRRVFLTTAAAVLGVGGAGLGYAAYNTYIKGAFFAKTVVPTQTNVKTVKPAPTKPTFTIPTTAKTMLTFTRHQQLVRSVGWSPDGTLLASVSDDTHGFIWSATDGTVRHDLGHPAAVHALAWSPDSQRLVTGANNQLSIFNVQNGTMLFRSTRRHTLAINSVAWTSHNQKQVVSAGDDMHAIVWDTTNYRNLLTYALHTLPIEVVSWAADGETVATCSQGGVVHVWHSATGRDLHGFYQDAKVPMRAMTFAPTGMQLVVGGDDGMIRFWNASTCGNAGDQCNDTPQRIQVSKKAIRALAWSPDGRFLASGADDGMFTLWSPVQNQKPLFTIQQNDIVRSIAWSPDGKQVATASGNIVTVWMLM